MNRSDLESRVGVEASSLLREKSYVSAVDLFIRLGFLSCEDHEAWRFRRVPCLERVIKINLSKICLVMRTLRRSCTDMGLRPSRTAYVSWGKGDRVTLRFSKSGDPAIKKAYATHQMKRTPRLEPSNPVPSRHLAMEDGTLDDWWRV